MKPLVTVVVPCRNERERIAGLLDAVLQQTYPRDRIEIVVADGMSEDGTRQLLTDYALAHPTVCLLVVDNPQRSIPSGLNTAIGGAKGEILVRLDAHCQPRSDYVEQCVAKLAVTGAANVGGAWDIRPSGQDWIARSIAVAGGHILGSGGVRYRAHGAAGPVDTVPFGAFPRAWISRLGGYDESMLTNEDYELNVRIRKLGGVVWFDPAIQAVYYARETLAGVARQYARYGLWKGRMLRKHPTTLKPRQAIPALLILSTALLALAGIATQPAALALASMWLLYLGLLAAASVLASIRRRDAGLLLGLPVALMTMHIIWGTMLWVGLATRQLRASQGSL